MSTNLMINGQQITCKIHEQKQGYVRFTYNDQEYAMRGVSLDNGNVLLEKEVSPNCWLRITGHVGAAPRNGLMIQLGKLEAVISKSSGQATDANQEARLSPLAPMPGMVRQILVKAGDKVSAGDSLAVLEAMKLQLTLTAGGDAMVEKILVKEGQMITEGVELVALKAEE